MQYISCIVERNETVVFLIITEEKKKSQNGIGRVVNSLLLLKNARGH